MLSAMLKKFFNPGSYSQNVSDEKFRFISDDNTMLLRAIDKLDCDKALEAIKMGANVNYRDKNERTPLHHVATRCPRMARLLVEHGAYVDAEDESYETPLHLAVHAGVEEVVHMLLFYEADACRLDSCDWSPFMVALLTGNMALQQLLLLYETDFNRVDKFGRTTLMLAIRFASNLVGEVMRLGAVYYTSEGSTPGDLRSVRMFQSVWRAIDYAGGPDQAVGPVCRYRLPEIIEYVASTDTLPRVLDDMHEMRVRRLLPGRESKGSKKRGLVNMLLSKFALEKARDLIYVFTSYGYSPNYREAESVFARYGRSDVYHFVAELDLVPSRMCRDYLLPVVMFDVSQSVEYHVWKFMETKVSSENSLHCLYLNVSTILQFFTTDYCWQVLDHFYVCGGHLKENLTDATGVEEALMRTVPSLQQLCRDLVRDRLCDLHDLKSFVDYRRLVNKLNLGPLAKILTFQTPVYHVSEQWLSHLRVRTQAYFTEHNIITN